MGVISFFHLLYPHEKSETDHCSAAQNEASTESSHIVIEGFALDKERCEKLHFPFHPNMMAKLTRQSGSQSGIW